MPHLHLQQSAELLDIIVHGSRPADAQLERYFRAHPRMGARDRARAAETVYGVLRNRRMLAHIAGGDDAEPLALVAAWLLTQGLSGRALHEAGFTGDIAALVERARNLDAATLPFAVRASLPDWLAEKLHAQFGAEEALALAHALNQPAPLDIRVNTLKATRPQVQSCLRAAGYETAATPYAPTALRCTQRAPLIQTDCFRDGLFEVQDEGSQLLALVLEPRRHEMVVDFCAGAGGKTLQLGALMANTGTVYAFDTAARRLERLTPRLRRSGLQNVRAVAIAHEHDERVRRLHGKIDRVLVDAPCSGTGTLRRNPDIKWRPLDLAALAASQTRILEAASRLLKVGGRLVYATCSLLPEENDAIVAAFLAAHPQFEQLAVQDILARRHVPLTMSDAALRLYPHRHHTDGFYAAVLQRRA